MGEVSVNVRVNHGKKTNEIYLIDHNKLEVSNASVIYAQYFDTLYRITDEQSRTI